MDYGRVEEELMVDTDGGGKRRPTRISCCRRYGLPVSLVIITLLSCFMSLVTAIIYFSQDYHSHHEDGTHAQQYYASRQIGDKSMDLTSPAYAHKILEIGLNGQKATAFPQSYVLQINPNDDYGTFEVSQGVSLLHHGIQIKHPGSYFVYKSVYFAHYSRLECGRLNQKGFISRLKLNSTLNTEGITTLLESIHTCCPTCQDTSETAFSGGVFYLKSKDVIQVEVEGENSVDVEKDVSYVGLMKLGTLR